jgi:hypothetical protein
MNARHVLTHVAVVVVGLGVATVAGVPFATALPFALLASCALMMLSMGGHGAGDEHAGHNRSAEIGDERKVSASQHRSWSGAEPRNDGTP